MITFFHCLNGQIVVADVNAIGDWVNPCFYIVRNTPQGPAPMYQSLKVYGEFTHNEAFVPFKDEHILYSYPATQSNCVDYRQAIEQIREKSSPIASPHSPAAKNILSSTKFRRK